MNNCGKFVKHKMPLQETFSQQNFEGKTLKKKKKCLFGNNFRKQFWKIVFENNFWKPLEFYRTKVYLET